ncbi:MAG TPA: protein-disulfide reductase DsbD domain-containing protein [Terracidiphilus sp.]|jgi:hypothetical protein
MARISKIAFVPIALFALASFIAPAQIVSPDAQSRSQNKPDSVAYLFPEQVTVPAGKPSSVAMHFRVAEGLHINSHTPSADYLIPTTFSIPATAQVRLDAADYPAGTVMTLPIDPQTQLSAYTGDFVIQARIVAAPGNHLVQGRLHYQACDQEKCMPPKTITVPIDVIGK